ncbi:hypothetical protein MRY82_10415 [bacterium]|nr:hypothetical protein [bacterium]
MRHLIPIYKEKKISFTQWLIAWAVLFLLSNFYAEDILKSSLGLSLSMYWLYCIGTVGLVSYEFIRREPSIKIANSFALAVLLIHAYFYITSLVQYSSGHYEAIKALYMLTMVETIIVSVFLVTKLMVKGIKSKSPDKFKQQRLI